MSNSGTLGYISVMRYDTDNSVAIVACMNRITNNVDRYAVLYEVAYSAKRILGYEVTE